MHTEDNRHGSEIIDVLFAQLGPKAGQSRRKKESLEEEALGELFTGTAKF
jgi:hypothetical protein